MFLYVCEHEDSKMRLSLLEIKQISLKSHYFEKKTFRNSSKHSNYDSVHRYESEKQRFFLENPY